MPKTITSLNPWTLLSRFEVSSFENPKPHAARPKPRSLKSHKFETTRCKAFTSLLQAREAYLPTPDSREDPKSRSLNGGSYNVPLVAYGPKLGDLLSRSSRGSGTWEADRRCEEIQRVEAWTPERRAQVLGFGF